jgi:hypothetical protein
MSLTNAHALVIGASQYQHIRPLPPVADAVDLASVLRDPTACGYDPASVVLLQESEATRARILDELDRLGQRAGRDATALVYFSGHGGQAASGGESYLMPIDGEWGAPDRLDATAISSRVLTDKLAAISAERLTVILDCCHAAGLAQPRDVVDAAWHPALADDALGRLATGRGRVVMAASRGDGASYVLDASRYGLFTEHLIAGLRGAAGGSDGLVRVLDLYHHVQRNVVARFPDQRPVLKTELEDNYPIALCPRGAGPALEAPSPTVDFAYDVLVVHATAERDRAWAQSTLIRLLEQQGVRVCVEELDAELGKERLLEIERLVTTSRFTAPVLTPQFSAGRLQELQTVMAQQLGIEDGRTRLIPIVREPCEARLGLRMLVHLDMIRDENVAPGVDRLVRTLRK